MSISKPNYTPTRTRYLFMTRLLAVLTGFLLFSTMSWSQNPKSPGNFKLLTLKIPRLRLGHPFAPGTLQYKNLEELQKQLREKGIANLQFSDGTEVNVEGATLIESVRSKKIDLAVVPIREVVSFAPRFGIFEIPFLFRDEIHVETVMYELGDGMLKDLSHANVVGLGWWPGEFLVLAGPRAVLEPGDLRGLRVVGASNWPNAVIPRAASENLFRQAGAEMINLAAAELYKTLPPGKFDVVEATLRQISSLRLPRLAITTTNHFYAGFILVAGPSTWLQLPEPKRKVLLEALQNENWQSSKRLRIAQREARKRLEQEWQASIFDLTSADHTAWYNQASNSQLTAKIDQEFVNKVLSLGSMQKAAGRGPSAVVSWNAWLEDRDKKDVAAPVINNVYRVNLDIARYAYNSRYSAAVSGGVLTELKRRGELTLLLIPVLTGNVFRPAPGSRMEPQKLNIRLDRTQPQAEDKELLEAFNKGNLATRKLSEAVNLGSIASWEVTARETGCGGFSVSVWDEARIAPLDNVEFTFGIGAPGHPAQECGTGDTFKAMSAGLETLLAGPLGAGNEETKAHAALHLFEVKDADKTRSVVVFVDRAGLKAALGNPDTGEETVFAWTTESQISDYVTSASGLPALISDVHRSIKNNASPYPFEEVSQELAITLFSGETDQDRAVAKRALQRLQEIVAAETEPLVLVRVVSARGKALYLPFGLLAAQAEKPVLPKPFMVIQPLKRWADESQGCISTWRAARPPLLEGVGGDPKDLLEAAAQQAQAPGIEEVLPNHNALLRYFDSAGEDRGEGLIILAHHHEGNLWFSKTDRPPSRIRSERIKRSYAPGSVALLAACATAGGDDSPETSYIAEKLISRGMEALIISPFAVDADFGTRFALQFEKAVAKARSQKTDAKLSELLDTTIKEMAVTPENQTAYRDMMLEFMVIGNPDLRLCK